MPTNKGLAPLIPLRKGGLGVVWVAILAAVLIGGGYVAYRITHPIPGFDEGRDLEKEFNEFLERKTADWKTYRNEKYGFEFKYPPHLFVHGSDKNWTFLTQESSPPTFDFEETCAGSDYMGFIVTQDLKDTGYGNISVDESIKTVEKNYKTHGGSKVSDSLAGDIRRVLFTGPVYGPQLLLYRGPSLFSISYHACGGKTIPFDAITDSFRFTK